MAIDRETQVLTTAYASGIRSRRELANYMAQVTHESNGLNRLQESFRYMRGVAQIPAQAAWRNGPQALDAARKEALLGRPQALAELMYGGRNGNDQPGDGYRYHGRGYLPVPGKDHYRAAGKALGLDLVGHPELAAEPEHAAKIAAWYWKNRVPPSAREDVRSATEALNGKLYGLDDRRARFESWERRLTPELMERLDVPATDRPASPMDVSAGSSVVGLDARRQDARRRSKTERDRSQTLNDTAGDMGDPVLMLELQRDVLEVTTEYVEIPSRRRGCHAQGAYPPLDQVNHPQHALFLQARDAVRKLDETHARHFDERSERLAAALTVAAHAQGLDRIDHVALRDGASRAFAVQGDVHSPLKQVTEVGVAQAIDTPIERSAKALEERAKPAEAEVVHGSAAIKHMPGH
jgi:putative chitinase